MANTVTLEHILMKLIGCLTFTPNSLSNTISHIIEYTDKLDNRDSLVRLDSLDIEDHLLGMKISKANFISRSFVQPVNMEFVSIFKRHNRRQREKREERNMMRKDPREEM